MSSATTKHLLMAVLLWSELYYFTTEGRRPPLPNCGKGPECFPAHWSPAMHFSWITDNKLTISFDSPPAMTRFKRFNVTLSKDGEEVNKKQIETHYITYELTCNGLYNFKLQPFDDFQWKAEDCYCYDSHDRCAWCKVTEEKFEFKTGKNCFVSKPDYVNKETENIQNSTVPNAGPIIISVIHTTKPSHNQTVIEENTSLPLVSQPSSNNLVDSQTTTIILISAGISLAVILGLVVVYFMFKSRSTSSTGIFQNYNNLVPEDETLATKNVLLLFSNDHDFHYNVVNCLTSCLENHFKCHILYAPCITEKGILQWLHKMVAECDIVLLLHSESVKRQCDAWRVGKEYSQLRDDPNESTLMPILAHLQACPKVQPYYSKFVSCHLKHLAPKYILHEFPSRENFALMKDLKELVCRLHQLPHNSNLKKAFKVTLDTYHNTPKGQSLIQAIDRAAKFEENEDWFFDKYKCSEYCTESTTADKCDCTSIFITDYQNGGLDYLKAPGDNRNDLRLPKPYFNDITSVSDISHCSTMLADINERNDRSMKNRNSFLETLPDDAHDLSM